MPTDSVSINFMYFTQLEGFSTNHATHSLNRTPVEWNWVKYDGS